MLIFQNCMDIKTIKWPEPKNSSLPKENLIHWKVRSKSKIFKASREILTTEENFQQVKISHLKLHRIKRSWWHNFSNKWTVTQNPGFINDTTQQMKTNRRNLVIKVRRSSSFLVRGAHLQGLLVPQWSRTEIPAPWEASLRTSLPVYTTRGISLKCYQVTKHC